MWASGAEVITGGHIYRVITSAAKNVPEGHSDDNNFQSFSRILDDKYWYTDIEIRPRQQCHVTVTASAHQHTVAAHVEQRWYAIIDLIASMLLADINALPAGISIDTRAASAYIAGDWSPPL